MNNEEFYIGWQGKAPAGISKHIRRSLIIAAILVSIVGLLLALNQKKFTTGNFEFGKLTELTGIFTNKPVPLLKVAGNKDLFGNFSTISIPLIGFGKFGAEGLLKDLERETGSSLEGLQLTLKGTLLYNDGKLLMQIDGNDKPLVKSVKPTGNPLSAIQTDLGTVTLKGEIVDPKCYFGVMKPGQGKPHKDCAIRCILGGIPPVLRVVDQDGRANYYLIVGPNGEPMNEAVQNWVAEPVSIQARAVKQDDWVILYTNIGAINAISKRELYFNDATAITCAATCIKK